MTYSLESMTEHLMAFVRMGDQNYAQYAAKRYAKTDPWTLADLPARLDVEIARWMEEQKGEQRVRSARSG